MYFLVAGVTVGGSQGTLFDVAARPGIFKERIFNRLLQAGSDLNSENQVGSTPLHAAAYHVDKAAALCMLRAGAKIIVVDAWRDTPLHSAAKCKNTRYKELIGLWRGVTAMAGNIMIDVGLSERLDLDSEDDKSSSSILMDHES
ncbi:hypothetical protein XANCAGTX0491_005949 [Xanthoria calcicola]